MADWIWHTATKNNIDTVEIDIINEKINPPAVQIRPIVSQLHRLRETIKNVLTSNDFPPDFIVQATFQIKILKDSKRPRYLEIKSITVDKHGKIYEGQPFKEEAYENSFNIESKLYKKSFLKSLKDLFIRN